MKNFVYADNAATTKLDNDAFEAMKPYLLNEYGNVSQPYSFSRNGKKALKEARETIAKCINATPEEIYFTSGGTESDNWAIKGTARNNINKHAIITSSFEHHAVLNSCKNIERNDRSHTINTKTSSSITTENNFIIKASSTDPDSPGCSSRNCVW